MAKKVSYFLLLALSFLCYFDFSAYGQESGDCPRVIRSGKLLTTDPAPGIRWLDEQGKPIPGGDGIRFEPPETGKKYSTEMYGTSPVFRFVPGGNRPRTLIGTVYDYFLKPVPGAVLQMQGQTVTSDDKGRFTLTFNGTDGRRETLSCRKNGFFTAVKGLTPVSGDTMFTRFILSEKKVNFTFDSDKGGTFTQPGIRVELPANGYMNASTGRPHNGKVSLSYRSARPGDAHFGDLMPGGDLQALNAGGQLQVLQSYGFTEVLLSDEAGNALQLSPHVTAGLQFLIPENLRSDAPETMPLWFLNETEGIWREEGTLTRNGAAYVGRVKHFTPWNCDRPYPPTIIKGRVVDCKGNPLPGINVLIDNYSSTLTNEKGEYRYTVGANLPFSVEVEGIRYTGMARGADEVFTVPDFSTNLPRPIGRVLMSLSSIVPILFSGESEDTLRVLLPFEPVPGLSYSFDEGNTYFESAKIAINKGITVKDTLWVRFAFKECTDTIAFVKVPIRFFYRNSDCSYRDYDVMQYDDYSYFLGASYPETRQNINAKTNFNPPHLSEFNAWLNNEGPCTQFLEADLRFLEQISFHPDLLGSLSELYVKGNGYSDITSIQTSFLNLPLLKSLSFSNLRMTTNIEENPLKLFDNLTGLERLNLTDFGSGLPEYPKFPLEAILRLPKLKVLTVSKSYEETDYYQFDSAAVRLLEHPALEKLGFYALPKKRYAPQKALHFPYLPIADNFKIKELDFRAVDSLVILPDLAKFKALTKLKMICCKLRELPASVTQLESLKTLDLTAADGLNPHLNELKQLPASMSDLADTLEELILTGNPIPASERIKIQGMLPRTRIIW